MKLWAVILLLLFGLVPTMADVDEGTGRMVLNERLATVSGNTISFNLDLQYSSGITVDQRASWIGLGFDISLPYIDRIPVGSIDEKADTFICNGPGFYSTKYYRKLLTNTGNGYSQNPDTGWFTSQQDIYTLNADFASGRILFAQPQSSGVLMQAYLQNWRPLVIKYNIDSTDNFSKWVIIAEDGTRYVFGQPVKARASENTAQSWFGTDSTWDRTSVWVTGMPGYWTTTQVISGDHYVNEAFNRRWYITEIQSPNYDTVTGKGERITFSYTQHSESYRVLISDLNKYASEYDRAATGLFSYTEGGHKHANFTFSYDNYYLHPIYPVEITSPTGKIRFVMSSGATYDKLSQGDKRIDKIEAYSKRDTSFVLASQILMNYDATGLAQGHPYSSGGKGLLRLNGIKRLSADGLDTLPVVAFEYGANPSFYPPACYYKHDFYGYYRSTELRRSSGTFSYPAGQSDTGTVSNPGAEAWSITRITSGEGTVVEYKYEPGIATKVSTNETVATGGSPLKIGVRVKRETISDGVSATNIVNTFEYGTGYTDHNYALRHKLDSLYAILNRVQYRNVGNVMVLGGAGVRYDYSIKSTSGSGSVKTYYVNPSSLLPIYQSNPITNLSMADVYLADSMSLNALSQFRGFTWKSESFKQGTSTNPVQTSVANYAIKYDLYSYLTPEVVSLHLATCAVGGGSGDTTMPQTADNQNQSDFIGYLRLTSSVETRDGVAMRNDVISYNATNGLPNKTRVTNSDGKQKLTRITYAIEEKKPDQSLVYQGMKDANMLSQSTETVVYEKSGGNTNTDVLSSDVRSAQTITYSNALGCNAWVPWQVHSWKSNFLSNGTPDKTFADFNHVVGATNPNWQVLNTSERLGTRGNILQISKPLMAKDVTIYRNDNMPPIGAVKGGSFYECGIFTGDYTDGKTPNYWDYDNGWEKGATNTVELVSGANAHFGERAIHVIRDYAAGRNNRVYPGTAYTMSAWVKVTSGTIKMATDFRYANTGHENDWPATQITTAGTPAAIWATPISTTDCNGKWKLMTMQIPASVTTQLDPSKVWYARAWVGDDPTQPSFEAYVDDVRFYPSDALVTTTFYESKWKNPTLSVDPNNNPGKRITYDAFARPAEWRKIDKTDPSITTLVQSKQYHLMGEQ